MQPVLSIYDVTSTLANIDANVPRLLVFGAVALICNFIYFGVGIYQGFKHKLVTIPICATLVFIPHDLIYLLMYDKWFNVYDHWFCKLFWVGLIITNIQEMAFFYIALKHGRKEALPNLSQAAWERWLWLALAGAFMAFWAIKYVLADELWLFTFGFTVWFCVPFVIPTMLKRNSAVGNTMLMWGAYILMAISYWAAVWPLAPFFQSPTWLGLGAMIVVWASVIIVVMKNMPSGEGEIKGTATA